MTTHHHDHDHTHEHEQSAVQPLLKIGLLAGLGIYFTYNIVTGNLANYINARFAWLSYVAAALFFALAVVAFYSWWRERNHDHHAHDHHHHHDHDHNTSWWVLLIVSMPLLFGVLVPSQPLGAEAISGEVRISAVSASTTTTLNANPLDRNILDWLRSFNFSSDLSEFNGQQAQVIGFMYREPDFPDEHFMVARFTVSCCVADSSAIGMPIAVNGLDISEISDGQWIEVSGTFEVGDFQEQTIPILQLSSIELVEQPEFPYLNP